MSRWIALLLSMAATTVANAALRYNSSVDTPSDLVAVNPSAAGGVVTVKEMTGAGADDGATFYYDASSVDVTNTTTVFATSTGVGRWIRLQSAGGSSVDLTGTNDLAGTGQLLNADYISSGYLLVSTNITLGGTNILDHVLFATTNVVYVDYANGDNATGEKGNPRRPYKTLEYLKSSNVLTGGEKVILSPGDHIWTYSGYNYSRSVSIQGAGMGVTRIVATNQSPAFGWVSGSRTPFYFDGNYPVGSPRLKEPDAFIEIRDLTIDLTDVSNVLPATANGKAGLGGVNANATTVVIENVEVLGYTSNDDNTTNYEAFGILGIGADVLISKCRAESAQNTYGSGITAGNYYLGGAFSLSGMSSCRVLDCFVDGNELGSSNDQGSRGIGVVNGNNVIVSGNQVVDVLTGLVNDTGGYTNYVISGNVINSLRYGMGCNSPSGFKGLTVVGNVFDADHYGILAGQAATTSTDIVVQGNTFKNAGTNLWFVNLSGGRVSFNNADSGDNSVSGASGVSYHNNYNEDGSVFSLITPNPVQAVSGIDFGNSIVAQTGSGTPEGSIVAPQGSLYLRNDGGAGTTLYVKQSGTGNTGWGAPGLDHTGNVSIGGSLTVTGDISNTGTLSVSNNITAYDTPAFGGAIISTTNRTLTASTVLNPAPAQLTLNGTEGSLALVGGPEGNFADIIDMVETSEDGTTLTDKWTLAKRTYSSNSALAFYYGTSAYMGFNTNVYYLTTAGDTWNKRNASVGGSLTVATNLIIGSSNVVDIIANAAAAAAVADGDKGDITVASSGASWTIDAGAVSADELNEAGVEAGLEAVLDLQDLQGAVTDAQVPDTITASNYVLKSGDTMSGTLNMANYNITNVQAMSISRVITPYSTTGVTTAQTTNVLLDCTSNTYFLVTAAAAQYLIITNATSEVRGSVKIISDGTARAISSPVPMSGVGPMWSKPMTNVMIVDFLIHTNGVTGANTNGMFGGGYAW